MRKREVSEPCNEQPAVDADLLSIREGAIKGTQSHGPGKSTGVSARSTSSRQSRELGKFAALLHSREGRESQPVNWEESPWGGGPTPRGCPSFPGAVSALSRSCRCSLVLPPLCSFVSQRCSVNIYPPERDV